MGHEGHGEGNRILTHGDSGIPQVSRNTNPVAFLYLYYLYLLFYFRNFAIIAPVVCKLIRNNPIYPQHHKIIPDTANTNQFPGIRILVFDNGPEFIDPPRFMEDFFLTAGNLSLRLPSTNSGMDQPAIVPVPGQGTLVSTNQWERYTTSVVRFP